MTVILSAHRGQDTGGQGHRIAEAFRADDDGWTFLSATNPNSVLVYQEYPVEVPWHWPTIEALYSEADLFHARNDWSTYRRLEDRFHRRLPAVIHYHGTNFRTLWPNRLREQRERGAPGLVSTLDLWLIRPEMLQWLPAPYDLQWLSSLRPKP